MLAGKEYGSGSSRDWAAKGPNLLGVRAVIAESYERIHRSNLLMMGILPLQYLPGESRESLGLTGREEFSVTGVANGEAREVTVHAPTASRSGRSSGSTPRASASTSATAASSRTCCGGCSPADGAAPACAEPTTSWGSSPSPTRSACSGCLDTGLLWGNLGVSLLVIVAGAILVPALSLPAALVAIVLGCIVGNLMLATAAAIGAQARVPAMVLLRAPLGPQGLVSADGASTSSSASAGRSSS